MPEAMRSVALKRIDAEAQALRIVLTSRTDEYRDAIRISQPDNTAVIELRPVKPSAAASYLLHGQTGAAREQWEWLAERLTRNPDSVIARALDNPLALSLARDVFRRRDPGVLTDEGKFPTVESVREHLIGQVLDAVYPEEQVAEATRGLSWIAHSMGTSRDLQWWDIPTWVPLWELRVARGLASGLAAFLAIVLGFGVAGVIAFGTGHGFVGAAAYGLASGVVFGVWFGAVARIRVAAKGVREANDYQLTLRRTRGVVSLASGYAGGIGAFLAGLLVLTFVDLTISNDTLLVLYCASVASTVTLGIAAWISGRSDRPAHVSGRERSVRIAGAGLVAGLVLGLGKWVEDGTVHGLAMDLVRGLIGGLICGIVSGMSAEFAFRIARRFIAKPDDRPVSRLWKLHLARKISVGTTMVALLALVEGFLFGWVTHSAVTGAMYAFDGISVIPAIAVLIILAFEWLTRPGTSIEGVPRVLTPRLPQRAEIARLSAACILFLPLTPFVLLNLWSIPVADSKSATAASTFRADRRSSWIYGAVCGLYMTILLGVPGGNLDGIPMGTRSRAGCSRRRHWCGHWYWWRAGSSGQVD